MKPTATRAILAAAGFRGIAFAPVDEDLVLGHAETGSARAAAEAAAGFALDLGPASRLVRDQPPAIRERAYDLVLRDFETRAVDGRVRLAAACWLVTATR